MAGGTPRYDVVVIGGGVIGCATARELAVDHDVLVLERDQIAGDASGKASGLVVYLGLRSLIPAVPAYGLSFFREYDGTDNFTFTERNAIELVSAGDRSAVEERVRVAQEHGYPMTFLDAETVEQRYPGVFELADYAGGLEYRDTGWVDPYTTAMTFKADAEDLGADVRTHTPVEAVLVEDGAVTGVTTPEETVRCSTVVCAAGWRTKPLLSGLVTVPVRPLRYQSVNLSVARELGPDYPMGIDPGTGFYWRPEPNGELHVGGGDYLVEQPGTHREGITEEFRTALSVELPQRLSGLEPADIVGSTTCPTGDAATPDGLPIIDQPAEAPDGLIVATGFHGSGIMLSPPAGAAVRSLVTGEASPFDLDPFALDRFDSGSGEFGLVMLSEKGEEDRRGKRG